MGITAPIVIIVIGIVLVVLALMVWSRRKDLNLERTSNKRKKVFFAQFITGLILALVAAIFMFDGDVLGENTSGISTVIGIIGISLIATSNVTLMGFKRKE